ncbi:MAG: hypothetical protein EBX41_08305 [Chitinophagia bacterium]|nr:hypothetical protein [Chitinophagia bacterium]
MFVYLCPKNSYMPQKVKPNGKQISMLIIHIVIFLIGSAAMIMLYDKDSHGKWTYPWPAWIVAAWGLLLIGHICLVFTSYEDNGYTIYRRQQGYDS